jgi:peroxiredoxin
MVETASNMMPLGTRAPDFTLPEPLSGQARSLEQLKSDVATVVMFICNHCPYVVHIIDVLNDVAEVYQTKGIQFIGISANDATQYPQDGPEKMAELSRLKSFSFPYLYDESQAVAKSYQAACTPDFYVFDKSLSCVYRGQFDGSRPGNEIPVTGADLTSALDDILNGQVISISQKPSMGCNIKWK